VVDDWYIIAYEPIRDSQNKFVGMPYVGILKSKYVVLKKRVILLLKLEILTAIAISSLPSFKILKKEFWDDIHSGQKEEQ
jgi:two-component system NtrC family sensor kinase